MHKNETVLTPIFRYIITCLEKSWKKEKNECLLEVINFIQIVKKINHKNSFEDGFVFDSIIILLKKYIEDEEGAKQFWEEQKSELEGTNCKKCQLCKKCSLYFWHELGYIIFNIENKYKNDENYIPLRTLPQRVYKHLEPSVKLNEIYNNRTKWEDVKIEDYILILKGMSSSTPSILNSVFDTDEFDGGGFYINYHGIGIVVDPGYHFVRNFHHYGLNVLDVDIVIITHEHIDHNIDMRLLDDLNNIVSGDHKIVWLMDEVSYEVAKIYQKNESGFSEKKNLLIKINPKKEIELSEYDASLKKIDDIINFSFFRTEHIFAKNNVLKNHTFGCRFTFLKDNRCMLYTSDTRYFAELSNELENVNIVIANISGIYEDDYMLVKAKDKHLGYFGCFSILRECFEKFKCTPELFMISEFWNGQNDIRFDVTKQIQENIMNIGIDNTRIVPAEKGMYVKISDSRLRCNQCGTFCEKYVIKRPSRLEENVEVICTECYYE